jgi:hypothetical protein
MDGPKLHSIAVRQYYGSKAGNQARTRDGAPQRRRCQTEKKSRREERGRGPWWCSRRGDGVVVAGSRMGGGVAKAFVVM